MDGQLQRSDSHRLIQSIRASTSHIAPDFFQILHQPGVIRLNGKLTANLTIISLPLIMPYELRLTITPKIAGELMRKLRDRMAVALLPRVAIGVRDRNRQVCHDEKKH